MFLVIRTDGKFWDGLGWNQKGRVFCSVGSATRSLHEEGESLDNLEIQPFNLYNRDSP